LALPAAIIGAFIFGVATWGDEAAEAWSLVGSIHPAWLAVALLAELGCFLLLAIMLRCLAGSQQDVRRLAPLRLAFIVFGLGSSLPAAPAEGMVMAELALRRRRLGRRRSRVVLGAGLGLSDAALYALAGVNALLVATVLHVHYGSRAMFALAGAALLIGLCLAGWLCSRRSFAEGLSVLLGRLRRPRHPRPVGERRRQGAAWHDALAQVAAGPRRWTAGLAYASCAWICDALCLRFSLLGLGARVSFAALLVAYTAGAISSQIPGLPAGVGIVETVTPTLLHMAGVALPAALAAVLVYRLLATVLPAVAGLGALLSMALSDAKPIEDVPTPTEGTAPARQSRAR
jgi:uncharacterized protein (TIRG00374 family)